MDFGTLNYIVLAVYMAAVVAVGLVFAGRQKTTEDYFLAGRKMPWLPVAMSMFASLTSAVTFMGLPGKAYDENISMLVVCFVSPCLVPFLVFWFYPLYRKMNVTTSYEYIGRRFGRPAYICTSVLFIMARLSWLGLVLYAPALAISVVTGIPVHVAIPLMGIVATLYTILGGLSAVLWTDVLQFIILAGGAVWVAVSLATGIPGGIPAIMDIAGGASRLQVASWKFSLYEMNGIVVALTFFLQMMQDYGTDQVTVQRMLAVNSRKGMIKAVIFNAVTDFVMIGLLLFIGIGLFAYFKTYPVQNITLQGDIVLPYYIMHSLPAGISGLVISAIFAAAMSSFDSGINSVATVIENDFIRYTRPADTGSTAVKRARIISCGLGIAAIILAFLAEMIGNLIEAYSGYMSLFSAPVLALFILGMISRRANFKSWLAGAVLAIVFTLWLQHGLKVNWVYYFPASFMVTFSVCWLTSLFSRQ